jgi:AcrR family transcriptional regulator
MVSYYLTMGQLQRARSPKAKEARREVILTAASLLFAAQPYEAITMAAVAQAARLAKGTVFLYFPTREALFLALLSDMQDDWMGDLHTMVARDEHPLESAELASLITGALAARPDLSRLLPLAAGVLEAHASPERVAEFRHRLLKRLFGTGALVEQRLGLARRGDGVRLLRYAYALIAGLKPDEDTDLRTALTVLGNGFHRRGQGPGVR